MIYFFVFVGCMMISANIIAVGLKKGNSYRTMRIVRFEPLAETIYDIFIKKNSRVVGTFERALQITGQKKDRKEVYREQIVRLSVGLRIVFFCSMICALLCYFSKVKDGIIITRPDYEEGTKTVELRFDIEGEKENVDLELEIEPVKSSHEEFDKLLDDVREYLIKEVKGDNTCLDEIYLPLNLVKTYPENDKVEISWVTDEDGYIDSDGNIDGILPGESKVVKIDALISFEEYRADIPIDLRLVYHKKDTEAYIIEYLKSYVKDLSDKGVKTIELPLSVGKAKLKYHTDKEEYKLAYLFFIMTVCTAVYVSYRDRKVLKKATEIRERLKSEYPDMVKEFLLLLKVGLNVPMTFEKLAFENEGRVYEFMRISAADMKNGADIRECIRKFGARCQLDEYLRFCAYIIQNIDKGSEKIISVLQSESDKAGAIEKNSVYKAGERAGEKLVFPLIVLLTLVIFIAVYPALAVL